ncbi:Coq4 family protein [uncultured Algimonas sp.]|uniref:Coq4 family protein n=1 Tax=uncultured Algimonas sp. TaxID=1547920 RepID=UPI0026040183|nr:Coq4 family protein [uncultured Algimonas sp.]
MNEIHVPDAIDVPRIPRRWIKAMYHFRKLIADKEDTSQVFHITKALHGNDLYREFNRFLADPEGRKRFAEHRYLPPLLDDRARLRAMPAGSLAQAYCDFMDREGLTAQGLVDEYDRFMEGSQDTRSEAFRWYNNRSRDTHDMDHVLTGYGRDALGETCVLAYSYQQTSGLGIQFIAYMGALEVKRWAPRGAPVIKAIREAAARGRAARSVTYYDLLDLLPRPLEEVRDMLGVRPMEVYPEVHRRMRDAGLDPYEALGGPQLDPVTV